MQLGKNFILHTVLVPNCHLFNFEISQNEDSFKKSINKFTKYHLFYFKSQYPSFT